MEKQVKITTKRLVIRELCRKDCAEFERTLSDIQKSAFGGSAQFLNWLISQYPAMDISKGLLSFGIFKKNTEKFVGTIGVGDHYDLHEPEIFYYLLPEYRGYGFATEAATAVTHWALENFPFEYLVGMAAVENERSQRVLERCGYRFYGVRTLATHGTEEKSDFKYYRYYKKK